MADDGLDGPQGFVATHSDAPTGGVWDNPPPPAVLERSLRAKGAALIGTAADRLWTAVANLDGLGARDIGTLLRG